jgi:UTP-glucose-1-phosphate uridylyltransferase
MKPTLLVLAAGMGSRYGGLKQIDPMGPSGETILDYSVFDALRAGFGKVVFIIRPDFEKDFRERIAAKFAGRIDVGFAFQTIDKLPAGFSVPAGREKPWGTTHAILCARDAVATPFAVINADDFYGQDSYAVLARHLQSLDVRSTDYSMVGFTLKHTLSEHGTVARGVCQTDASGRLTDIQELTKIAKLPSGAFLRAKGNEMKSEAYIPMSVGNLIRAGQATCQVLRTDSAWFGVTYREDKPIVQASILRQVQSGAYPASLWS